MPYQFVDPAKLQMNSTGGDTPAAKAERRRRKKKRGNVNEEITDLLADKFDMPRLAGK